MLPLRGLWSRHKRTILISLGVLGGWYAVYKLYDVQRSRILQLEKQLEGKREVDELIKSQLQAHFENIQRISDTTTLPYAVYCLRSRISEELDLSQLTEKLMQGKGQSGALTSKEKLELWDKLKVLSFTRTASSLWSMTMLCLYVRVQVNILGRHIYLEIARGSESSLLLDKADSFSRHGQHDFLATADFLSTYALSTLITNMQNAATETLKEEGNIICISSDPYRVDENDEISLYGLKQLRDPFSMVQLREALVQMLELFMSTGVPNHWISYLVPKSTTEYKQLMTMSSGGLEDSSILVDIGKLDQLMSETRGVLSSPDFANILDTSLRKVVDVLVEDIAHSFEGSALSSVPLAKLLPRVTQWGPSLLEEPSSNKFVQAVCSLPEVQLFFTLLYANIPPA